MSRSGIDASFSLFSLQLQVRDALTFKMGYSHLGLYRSSAPAPAEIRPFLQIRLISGSSQNWAGFWPEPDLENFR